ncbi:hypothetical protein BD289DRAFT_449458 [Coniella lustricola]|uniref:Uncharacterized protein n=1 Tax=Coniella lustricola TaxID=2025994 RepID=A0A2T3ALR7_9PEZI|nr:hypothetical protein BD289DRAFT_449458 [Coniella lustricola]
MAAEPTDRRKPFTKWVRKLNQKMKRARGPNNPYPQSGHVSSRRPGHNNDDAASHAPSTGAYTQSRRSTVEAPDNRPRSEAPRSGHSVEQLDSSSATNSTTNNNNINRHSMLSTASGRPSSRAHTDLDGEGEVDCRPPTTAPSYGGTSLAGTMITATDPRRPDSTFSSPAPSARSVATTLSTIQSHMANGLVAGAPSTTGGATANHANAPPALVTPSPAHHANGEPVQYSQPQALVTGMPSADRNTRSAYRPATYSAIIANNLLNDNISILTLASSTQRRRRRSWETDFDHASVRALPPSQFGGSRESLPLSVLSANLDGQPTSPGLTTARSIAERSVTGLVPGHARADSLNGSIGGGPMAVASES